VVGGQSKRKVGREVESGDFYYIYAGCFLSYILYIPLIPMSV